ncbi:MAG: hypothetical protein V4577_13695 [Bacteroidota bacterium]
MPAEAKLCWYIDEKEKAAALLERRQFNPYFDTSEYFHITEHGGNYLRGNLGRIGQLAPYFESLNNNTLTYFIDYHNRQYLFFTFDRTSLYMVTSILPGRPLVFTLKQVDLRETPNLNKEIQMNQTHIKAGKGSIITVGDNNQINYQLNKGSMPTLKTQLSDLGIETSEIEQLLHIVETERPGPNNELPQKSESWIKKVLKKSSSVALDIGKGITKEILTAYLKQYYGI